MSLPRKIQQQDLIIQCLFENQLRLEAELQRQAELYHLTSINLVNLGMKGFKASNRLVVLEKKHELLWQESSKIFGFLMRCTNQLFEYLNVITYYIMKMLQNNFE